MDWTILGPGNYHTGTWSGGTTTQLAIWPPDALYADRTFLWRLSSAEVRLPESDFTPLPDYDRFLTVLKGTLAVETGKKPTVTLSPFSPSCVLAFDGADPTRSRGTCTDFNLMVRKGAARGSLTPLSLPAGSAWSPEPSSGQILLDALFCVTGSLRLPESRRTARPGELLLAAPPGARMEKIEADTPTKALAVRVVSQYNSAT